MTFDNLLDLQPNVRLADLIQLFLMGYDDKIYVNVIIHEANLKEPIELSEVRIIDSALKPYYEYNPAQNPYKIAYLEDSYYETPGSMMTINLIKEDN
jgi:hypothetical protein